MKLRGINGQEHATVNDEYGDLSAFRRFIEQLLNLDGLGETKLSRLSPGYAPTSKRYATLPQDLRASWNQLHEYGVGPDYLGDMLTDFEHRVRDGLQDELVAVLRRAFGDRLDDAELRGIIAYTMTAGWLVLGSLSEKYSAEDAADDDVDMADLF